MVRDDESAGNLTFILVTNRPADVSFTVQVCTENIDLGPDLGMATGNILQANKRQKMQLKSETVESMRSAHAVHKLYYCCYIADVDYESGTFDVIFGVGDTSAEVSINITDDSIDEGSEAFGLVLKTIEDTPALVEIIDPMNATGIIDDDDAPGMSNNVKCKYA